MLQKPFCLFFQMATEYCNTVLCAKSQPSCWVLFNWNFSLFNHLGVALALSLTRQTTLSKGDYNEFPESARECSEFSAIVTEWMSFPSDLSEVAR